MADQCAELSMIALEHIMGFLLQPHVEGSQVISFRIPAQPSHISALHKRRPCSKPSLKLLLSTCRQLHEIQLESPVNFVSSFAVFQPTSRCPATFSSATVNTCSRMRDFGDHWQTRLPRQLKPCHRQLVHPQCCCLEGSAEELCLPDMPYHSEVRLIAVQHNQTTFAGRYCCKGRRQGPHHL